MRVGVRLGGAGVGLPAAGSLGDGVDGPGADARTGGRATSVRGRPVPWTEPSAATVPVTEPTRVTTEAAATITPRRTARLRAARRSARRRVRKPDTVPFPPRIRGS